MLRSGIAPVTLIVLAAGLSPVAHAQASAGAPWPVPRWQGRSPGAGTAYVLNYDSDTVTPIATATNTPRDADPGGIGPLSPRSHGDHP